MAATSPRLSASGTAMAAVRPPRVSVVGSRMLIISAIDRPVPSASPTSPRSSPPNQSK